MIVKDLSKSFYPCPKNTTTNTKNVETKSLNIKKNEKKSINKTKKNKTKRNLNKEEFSIMPESTKYSIKRTKKYCERHEAIFGDAFRDKSIEDGLIVFLTRADHRGTNGVHGKNGDKLNRLIKKNAQKTWMKYYKKTKEEWIKRYGQSFL